MRYSISIAALLVGVSAWADTTDPMDEKMRHCPPAVDGARTAIKDADKGVEVTVTADKDAEVTEIRRRVKHLEEFTRRGKSGTPVKHGGGAGGGWMRNCPIVTKDTLVTGTDVPHGSRILVQPKETTKLAELRAEVRRRYGEMGKPPAPAPAK
jgi:hypothetical protein